MATSAVRKLDLQRATEAPRWDMADPRAREGLAAASRLPTPSGTSPSQANPSTMDLAAISLDTRTARLQADTSGIDGLRLIASLSQGAEL